MLNRNVVLQELNLLVRVPSFFVSALVLPLTLSIITFLSAARTNPEAIQLSVLISSMSIWNAAVLGASRSLEKEKHQNTISLLLLTGTNPASITFNKIVANVPIGLLNCGLWAVFASLQQPKLFINVPLFLLAGTLLMFVAIAFAGCVSFLFFILERPTAVSGMILRSGLLLSGTILPLVLLPPPLALLARATGLPQIFALMRCSMESSVQVSFTDLGEVVLSFLFFVFVNILLFRRLEKIILTQGRA